MIAPTLQHLRMVDMVVVAVVVVVVVVVAVAVIFIQYSPSSQATSKCRHVEYHTMWHSHGVLFRVCAHEGRTFLLENRA
jgi:hypothetical protein